MGRGQQTTHPGSTPSERVSPRQQLAQRIADFITDHRLAQVFGGDVVKSGRYYAIGMSLPAVLDGEVRVYGPTYILIRMVGRFVGGEDSRVFASEEHALAFLTARFVDHDEDAAERVPTKPPRN